MNQTLQAMQIQPTEQGRQEEGYLHYLAREGRWALRWCIGLCMIGVVVVMVSPLWFVAVVPAGVMLLCYILLLAANAIERRSDKAAHDVLERSEVAVHDDIVEDNAEAHQLEPNSVAVIKHESKTGIIILFVAVLGALLIAFMVFPMRLFAIGALAVFAYMIFITAPVLLGAFNDDIEDERERLEGSGAS